MNQPEGATEELAWVLGLVDADSPEDTEDIETVVVHWVEDHSFQVGYLAVEGDQNESFAEWLRGELPLLNYAGREFDRVSYDLLRWALHDPEPLVRRNALLAASVMNWQQLVPLLTSVSETENDPTVREQAMTTLDIVRGRIARQGSTRA